ncbi:MAG: MarR family EPS-associated transcriptional regulator [Candidatus Firestonebacteria bacterium]|nr:MarR family EPS-associated transcriptional regulator [Candidatus Firestonebacteria bacterium]
MTETDLKIIKEFAENSKVSQRKLALKLGISLGKTNYLINELLNKGYIKIKRFKNSKNKIGYIYSLTPSGINEKINLTYVFLKKKNEEYNNLKEEIKELERSLNIE